MSARAATDPIAVPVDLTRWFGGDEAERDAVAAEVVRACSESGFLAITGHRVPLPLMRRVLDVSGAFFDLPVVEKSRYIVADKAANRGYAPFESEALSYSLGVDSAPDLFEAFNVGCESVPEHVGADAAASFFAPNIWPDHPADMREIYTDYFGACGDLSATLCEVFGRALGIGDDFFAGYHDRAPTVMRANNYQRRPEHGEPQPDQLRMGAHTDYGSLTILLADPVFGFQVRDDSGTFHDVLPPPDGFLVNLGDLLAEWTNDRWRSTVHRVVPPPADQPGAFRRRSIAWFQQPNHDAVIDVLDVCCDDDNPPRYPTTTSGEHLMAKLMGPRTGHEADVDAAFLAGADGSP